MRLNWNFLRLARLALLALMPLAGSGCSGINATGSVSPMDFLIPGMGHFLKANPPATNAPATFPEISTEVASTK